MKDLAWAFVERLLPRVASAVVMLVFAAVTSPSIVGSYAWMVIALTGVQSIFDAAVRQIAVGAVRNEQGLRFLRRYRIVFSIVGPLVMLGALFLVSASAERQMDTFLSLLPMVFTPIGIAIPTIALARLQTVGRWRLIALVQSGAVMISLAATLPLVIVTQSALGPSFQSVLVELVNAAVLVLVARRVAIEVSSKEGNGFAREFRAASWYAGLGWAQSQADRVLVGAMGGERVLGLYSFSWSLSRNVGDALSYASVNVLRPQLLREDLDDASALRILRGSLRRINLLLIAISGATFVGATWILPLILDDRWTPVFTAVPIMSLSSFALVTAWSLTPMLVRAQRLGTAIFGKVLGVLLAIPVGIVAASDLTAAAWVALAREILVALCLAIAARRTVPWNTYVPPVAAMSTLALLFFAYQMFF